MQPGQCGFHPPREVLSLLGGGLQRQRPGRVLGGLRRTDAALLPSHVISSIPAITVVVDCRGLAAVPGAARPWFLRTGSYRSAMHTGLRGQNKKALPDSCTGLRPSGNRTRAVKLTQQHRWPDSTQSSLEWSEFQVTDEALHSTTPRRPSAAPNRPNSHPASVIGMWLILFPLRDSGSCHCPGRLSVDSQGKDPGPRY